MCEGLAAILGRQAGIYVSGLSSSYGDAIAAVSREQPRVMVIGHEPPVFDGIDLARRLSDSASGTVRPAIVLLIDPSSVNDVLHPALAVGVLGVLIKDEAPNLLGSSIRSIADGAVVLTSPVAELVRRWSAAPKRSKAADRMLSGRERDVLRLIARGLNNDEIAVALSVSVPTVKSHVRGVFRKFNLRDRAQAVVLAYEAGLVQPGRVGSEPFLDAVLDAV